MKFKIQIFEHVPRNRPKDNPEVDDRKPAAKRMKKEPEDDAQSVAQDETMKLSSGSIYILEMMVKNIIT